MKRRKFFSNLSWSMAGLGLASSCSNLKEKDLSQHAEPAGDQATGKVPAYRGKIKTTFSKGDVISSNKQVVLALIGAGH